MTDPKTTPERQAGSHSKRDAQTAGQRAVTWIAPVALLVALVAVGLAGWALKTPAPQAHSDSKQTTNPDDAKKRVCTAFDTVSRAVQLQTHTDLGPDPVPMTAVAANARLALLGGGQYLLTRLDPATSPELASAATSFAQTLQDVGINALTGIPNTDPAQAARLAEGEASRQQVADLCK